MNASPVPDVSRRCPALALLALGLVVGSAGAACNTARAKSQGGTAEVARATLSLGAARGRLRPNAATHRPATTDNTPSGSSLGSPEQTPVCPLNMTRIDDFCIDRYEAVLVQRSPDGKEIAHPAHERPEKGVRYEARSVRGVRPQAYISQVDSEAACQNAGKRLCSVSEWYTACRGSGRRTYPYGDRYERGKCNSGKPHLLGRMFGNNARLWSYDNFNNPRLNQQPGFLSPTGGYEQCVSDYGAYDMVGNLHEWVSDRVDPSLGKKVKLLSGVQNATYRNTGNGVFMGGFYSTTDQQGEGCHFTTVGHERRYHDYSTGFRCCQDLQGR